MRTRLTAVSYQRLAVRLFFLTFFLFASLHPFSTLSPNTPSAPLCCPPPPLSLPCSFFPFLSLPNLSRFVPCAPNSLRSQVSTKSGRRRIVLVRVVCNFPSVPAAGVQKERCHLSRLFHSCMFCVNSRAIFAHRGEPTGSIPLGVHAASAQPGQGPFPRGAIFGGRYWDR